MDSCKLVLICEDSFDSIMTAVYDGWRYRNQGRAVELTVGQPFDADLFSEYQTVAADLGKAVKVAASIRKKISERAHIAVYQAAMHFAPDRAQVIFLFLTLAYQKGGSIMDDYGNPHVARLLALSRKVSNETHLFRGFVRFHDVSGVLVSRIEPKCNVLPLLGDDFADRFPGEHWAIYDERRKLAAIHPAGGEWGLVSQIQADPVLSEQLEREGDYEKLWKTFFNTIEIESRRNPRCQRTMLPNWYRKNMTEFRT